MRQVDSPIFVICQVPHQTYRKQVVSATQGQAYRFLSCHVGEGDPDVVAWLDGDPGLAITDYSGYCEEEANHALPPLLVPILVRDLKRHKHTLDPKLLEAGVTPKDLYFFFFLPSLRPALIVAPVTAQNSYFCNVLLWVVPLHEEKVMIGDSLCKVPFPTCSVVFPGCLLLFVYLAVLSRCDVCAQ